MVADIAEAMPNSQDDGDATPRSKTQDEKMQDQTTTASTRPPTFVASRALKAARTRAFRHNFQAFTDDEAEALSPANVFVKLKISDEKLRHSGIPAIKTRWEDEVATRKTLCDGGPDPVVKQPMKSSIGDTAGVQTESGGERDEMEVEVDPVNVSHSSGGKAVATEILTNRVGSPRPVGHPSQSSITHVGQSSTLTPHSVSQHEQLVTTAKSTHADSLPVTADQLNQTKEVPRSSKKIGFQTPSGSKNPSVLRHLAVKSPTTKRTRHSEAVDSVKTTPAKRSSVDLVDLDRSDTFVENAVDTSVKQVRLTPDSDHLDPAKAVLHQSPPHSTPKRRRGAKRSKQQNHDTQNLSGIDRTARQLVTPLPTPDPDISHTTNNMAPVRDPNNVDSSLKDAIQKLYEVQSQVHGFVPETQPLLIDKMTEVANSLAHLQKLTSPTLSPNNPIHKNRIAPEVIDYVDDSRNPDIYNREFVELVQRGNAVMNGKQQAFKDFSQTFAQRLRERMPELTEHVDKIMKNANFDEKKANLQKREDSGANGDVKTERKADGRKDGDSGVNGARVV